MFIDQEVSALIQEKKRQAITKAAFDLRCAAHSINDVVDMLQGDCTKELIDHLMPLRERVWDDSRSLNDFIVLHRHLPELFDDVNQGANDAQCYLY